MSKLTLDLSKFRSAGIYTIENDLTESPIIETSNIRLVVGFDPNMPFNTPVFINSETNREKILGKIDTKLEKKGCYLNRFVETLLQSTPVFVLNLLKTDVKDKSEYCNVATRPVKADEEDMLDSFKPSSEVFANFFNRNRFWKPDAKNLQQIVTKNALGKTAPFISAGNCGTKDISFIVYKPQILDGFNMKVIDWYGSPAAIPYTWIDKDAYISDYFVTVVAVEGDWSDHEKLGKDPYWSKFFDARGLKTSKLNNFLQTEGISLVGSWTGSVIPNFRNKTGENLFIEDMINTAAVLNGFLFSINKEFEDNGDMADIDLIGHGLTTADEDEEMRFLSYGLKDVIEDLPATKLSTMEGDVKDMFVTLPEFENIAGGVASAYRLNVGDYVKVEETDSKGKRSKLAKVEKKVWVMPVENKFTYDGMEYTIETDNEVSGGLYLYKVLINDNTEIVYGDLKKEDPDMPAEIKILMEMTNEEVDALEPAEKAQRTKKINAYNEANKGKADSTEELNNSNAIKVIIGALINNVNTRLVFSKIGGLRLNKKHLPGYDTEGNVDPEAGIEKIYGMLTQDPGIYRGLTNKEMVDFRYIIDSMGYGLKPEMGGKRHLSKLAKDKGKCTAVLSMPSIAQFETSTDPYFCDYFRNGIDLRPGFNSKYIPTGGNFELGSETSYNRFTLPSEENGATYTAVFGPYLIYNVNNVRTLIPPAADVANVLMRKHIGGDPYAIAANKNGLLSNRNLIDLEYKFDKYDRDELEPFGINPIITRGNDILIYGNRTAYQRVHSDFNFLHVRELLNTIEIEIEAILEHFPFDYNNEVTRSAIITLVAPILESMKTARVIHDYDLVMQTPTDGAFIDETIGVLDVGVEFTKGLEKIIQRINVKRYTNA